DLLADHLRRAGDLALAAVDDAEVALAVVAAVGVDEIEDGRVLLRVWVGLARVARLLPDAALPPEHREVVREARLALRRVRADVVLVEDVDRHPVRRWVGGDVREPQVVGGPRDERHATGEVEVVAVLLRSRVAGQPGQAHQVRAVGIPSAVVLLDRALDLAAVAVRVARRSPALVDRDLDRRRAVTGDEAHRELAIRRAADLVVVPRVEAHARAIDAVDVHRAFGIVGWWRWFRGRQDDLLDVAVRDR